MPDNQHYPAPEPWHIDYILSFPDRPANILRRSLRAYPYNAFLERSCHRGGHKARLDRDYSYIRGMQPVTKTLHVYRHHALCSPVDIVAFSTTITRHGRNNDNTAPLFLLKIICQVREQRHHTQGIHFQLEDIQIILLHKQVLTITP